QTPKAVEDALGHVGSASDGAFAGACIARGESERPPQHFDEQTGEWQVGPVGPGADMEEHDEAMSALARGDERRMIAQCRPHMRLFDGGGFGQYLLTNAHIAWRSDSGEGR